VAIERTWWEITVTEKKKTFNSFSHHQNYAKRASLRAGTGKKKNKLGEKRRSLHGGRGQPWGGGEQKTESGDVGVPAYFRDKKNSKGGGVKKRGKARATPRGAGNKSPGVAFGQPGQSDQGGAM